MQSFFWYLVSPNGLIWGLGGAYLLTSLNVSSEMSLSAGGLSTGFYSIYLSKNFHKMAPGKSES